MRLHRTSVLLAALAGNSLGVASTMVSEASFSQLAFLQGYWQGVGPDGKAFFDEYQLATPTLFRSIRHKDANFDSPGDGSTVELKDGAAISTWGAFTWKSVLLTAKKACFEPLNAPSSFCWEQMAPDRVNVTQRWPGADGKEQSFVLELRRVKR